MYLDSVLKDRPLEVFFNFVSSAIHQAKISLDSVLSNKLVVKIVVSKARYAALVGLNGGGGSLLLKQTLLKIPGVVHAYVNTDTEMAYIEYDPIFCNTTQIIKVIKLAGFDVYKPSLR